MRWRLMLKKEFSPELIYIKGSKNIVANALSHLYKLENLNNTTYINNNKVESTLESVSENFALNKEDVPHPPVSKLL